MKLEIKSIGIWSLIKVSVFINMIIGFIFGFFYAIMISFMSSAGLLPLDIIGNEEIPLLAMLIVVPIMFSIGAAVFGTMWAVICIFIYNLLSRIIGGVEINVDDISVKENISQPQHVVLQPPVPQVFPKTDNVSNSPSSIDEKKNDQGPDTNYEI